LSLQRDRLFRADFLAAEAGDTDLRVHLGKVVDQGQSRHGALVDAGAAGGALVGVGFGPQQGPLVKKGLNIFVVMDGFTSQGRHFEIADGFQLPEDFVGIRIILPQTQFLCSLKESEKAGVTSHHGGHDAVQGNGIVVEGGKLYPLIGALERLLSSESVLKRMKEKSKNIINILNLIFCEANQPFWGIRGP